MIRYYTVNVDLANGDDNDYSFRYYEQAENKFNDLKDLSGVTYISMSAFDDDRGDVLLKRIEK